MFEKQQIRDFRIALKDFEPMVKNPEFLRRGRDIPNFQMRPREAWANWLLCVVLQEVYGRDVTFAEIGDGVILDKTSKQWVLTEHVSALDVPGFNREFKGEERVLKAIEHKIMRGEEYARGKTLVVFLEDAGVWHPNRVGRSIAGRHNFNEVCCVALLDIKDGAYSYSVSFFQKKHSPTWKVEIASDFTDWKIVQLQ